MAITTLDGILAGVLPPELIYKRSVSLPTTTRYSYFYDAGCPGAAVAPTPGIGGAALTAYAGQIPFTNPGAGNSYQSRFVIAVASSLGAGSFMLCDRLWHNSGMSSTSTSPQTINSVTLPGRDMDGSTNGEGVYAAVEWSTAGGAGTPNLTLSYTNQDGTTGRTTPNLVAVTTPVLGTFEVFSLAAGDTGIRSIQTYTASATRTSGTFHLVMFRIIATTPGNVGSTTPFQRGNDPLTGNFPRLYDNTVPFVVNNQAASGGSTHPEIIGQMIVAQG